MSKICKFCGAAMEDSAKVCSNCGKVNTQPKKISENNGENQFCDFDNRTPVEGRTIHVDKVAYKDYRSAQAQNVANHGERVLPRGSAPVKDDFSARQPKTAGGAGLQQDRKPFSKNAASGKSEHTSRIAPVVKNLLKILVVLVVAYFGFATYRVLSTSRSDYKFDTDMKMVAENYSEAVKNYFDEGKWRFSLENNKVTYTGQKDGEEYVMEFKKESGEVIVSRLTIDGKSVATEDIMELYVMGMFMAESKEPDKNILL